MPSQPHYWRLAWLMPLLFALQTTWLSTFAIRDVPLDLAFGVALCAAMLGGVRIGFLAGAGAGFLVGVAAMWHPGSFVLSRLLPCLLVGVVASRFRASHPVAPPLVALLGAMLSDGTFVLLSPNDFPFSFWQSHIVGAVAGQVALAWPLFLLTQRLVAPRKKLMWE